MSTAYLYGNHKEKFYTKYIFYFMDGVEKRIKRNKRDNLGNILIFPSHPQFTFLIAIFAPTYLKIIPRALMLGVSEEQESLDVWFLLASHFRTHTTEE